jgi:hypothetical protein
VADDDHACVVQHAPRDGDRDGPDAVDLTTLGGPGVPTVERRLIDMHADLGWLGRSVPQQSHQRIGPIGGTRLDPARSARGAEDLVSLGFERGVDPRAVIWGETAVHPVVTVTPHVQSPGVVERLGSGPVVVRAHRDLAARVADALERLRAPRGLQQPVLRRGIR